MLLINTENEYYLQLVKLIDEIIPKECTELAVYVEFLKTKPVFSIFFRTGKDERFLEINEIPEKYSVSKETFDEQYRKLSGLFFDLRRGYEKEYKGRECKTISLFVVDGEIISEYTSSLDEKSSFEKRLTLWKYKEIGVIDSPEDAVTIEKHFGSVNRGGAQGIKRRPYRETSAFDELKELGDSFAEKMKKPHRAGGLFRAFAALMRLIK